VVYSIYRNRSGAFLHHINTWFTKRYVFKFLQKYFFFQKSLKDLFGILFEMARCNLFIIFWYFIMNYTIKINKTNKETEDILRRVPSIYCLSSVFLCWVFLKIFTKCNCLLNVFLKLCRMFTHLTLNKQLNQVVYLLSPYYALEYKIFTFALNKYLFATTT
jgi:hypothetical protein